jgi:hypothetical protein
LFFSLYLRRFTTPLLTKPTQSSYKKKRKKL